jgi:hypothetical protein
MNESDEAATPRPFHETDAGHVFYERTMPTIAQQLTALTIIGNQLKKLNENIEGLRGMLEKLKVQPERLDGEEPSLFAYLRREAERLIGRVS